MFTGIARKIAALLLLPVMLLAPEADAICRKDAFMAFSNILRNINWHCTFPIRIAGVKIDPYEGDDTNEVSEEEISQYLDPQSGQTETVRSADRTDRRWFCHCEHGLGFSPVGIRVGFWEPARVVEVVKDAWCFPFLGAALRESIDVSSSGAGTTTAELMERMRKSGGTRSAGDGSRTDSFWQAHYYVFPVLAILDILTDFICLEQSPMDLAYITEVDPRWDDGGLSALLNPDALLFANPLAIMACAPDAIAGTIKSVINPLYWCMGGWGPVYPLTGASISASNMQAMAATFGRVLFLLHKSFMLFGTIGEQGLCQHYPMPIWKKSQYRWHLVTPVHDPKCRVIGEPSIYWETFKNPPSPKNNIDNFSILLWRKRTCCAR